jgi:hypothetical protein
MLLLQLLKHYYWSGRRSPLWERNLATSIMMGFMMLYFGGIFLTVGLLLHAILLGINPDTYPLYTINRYLLPYFAGLFVSNYFMQKVPLLRLQPYLALNIHKKTLVNFALVMMLFSSLGLGIYSLIFTPFILKLVFKGHTFFPILAWSIAVFCTDIILTLCVVQLKRLVSNNIKVLFYVIAVVAALGALQYFGYFSLLTVSEKIFDTLIDYPVSVLAWIAATVGVYLLTQKTLVQQIYLDSVVAQNSESNITAGKQFSWLEQKGLIGQFLLLESKLILRNKRTKTILYMSLVFVFYGLIFMFNPSTRDSTFFAIFASTFTTGGFIINYGQFLFSWESSYWDGLLTRKIPMESYLRAKYYLFLAMAVIALVLSIPLVYFGKQILINNIAMFFYNMGVNTIILFFATTFNKKRIDLSQGNAMNWQGIGAAQWLLSIPIFTLPVLIFSPFSYFYDDNAGTIALAVVGIIGMALHPIWLKIIAKQLQQKKYETAEGFRQKD